MANMASKTATAKMALRVGIENIIESGCIPAHIEHFQKFCSHSGEAKLKAVFLSLGFVSAQSQGFSNLLLRQSLAKPQKSSLRIGYNIFSNALDHRDASLNYQDFTERL
jgi:hypothetical protein